MSAKGSKELTGALGAHWGSKGLTRTARSSSGLTKDGRELTGASIFFRAKIRLAKALELKRALKG